MKLKVLVLVLAALTSACAGLHPAQQGLNLMNEGNHQAAYDTLSACAQAGDPYCTNNLGVMYDRGYMAGGRDVVTAAHYYTLAARYGVPIAQQNLIALGRPVPLADLQAAYQQRLIQKQQAEAELAHALGFQLGCALGGGCSQSSTGYTPPPVYKTAPSTVYTPPPVYQTAPTSSAPTTVARSHSSHYWRKYSEAENDRGIKVCTWKCGTYPEHYATTTGYGYCGLPNL